MRKPRWPGRCITMKKQSVRIITLMSCACFAASAFAQDNRDGDSTSSRSSATRQEQSASSATEKVRVTRATNFLGSDVIATDGRKVGDIVDYYFNLGAAPRLDYVVIMTGGFLDMGGDRRAVPASAVSMSGETCRINIGSDQFWDVPVLPENRDRFLADAQNRNRLSQFFTQSNRTASAGQANTGATVEDANSAGAPTGRTSGNNQRDQQQQQLVSFNALRNADAYGENDTRLGFFVDAWINVNNNRAPYVELSPTFQPFRTSYDRRFAIPTAKLEQQREFYGYDVAVTADELDKAEPVSEAEGVKMLEDGRIGNTVLRVTVAQK